jgi:outer membrane protein TolC
LTLGAQAGASGSIASSDAANGVPVSISLEHAIALALKNDPAYGLSKAERESALLDRNIARSALLPQASINNQYLYTEPNGLLNQAGQGVSAQPAPRFIANNAIREYASQIVVTETLSGASLIDLSRTRALAAKATADLELSRRDLVLNVVTAYFGAIAADDKMHVAERANDESRSFDELTRKLEGGREVAHADVAKADLQMQQGMRELDDARLAAEKARLDLAVLLFPDPRMPYTLAGGAGLPTLASRAEIEAAAGRNNPDLRSALEALRASEAEVRAARAGYLPTLTFAYNYGIDAPQVAVNGPDGARNLGYSAMVGLDFPVWDWFATHDKVKQSQLRKRAAEVTLTNVQRVLIAQLEEFYDEAKIANDHLASLEKSVTTAQESLRFTKLRYQAGEATALEVVDAQTALRLAETARADGAVRYRVALANLQTLTGTL